VIIIVDEHHRIDSKDPDRMMRPTPLPLILSLIILALASGCATTQMAAEWMTKEYAGQSLKGKRVLVACQAPDPTVQRLCEDELAKGLEARGVTAVRTAAAGAPPGTATTEPQPPATFAEAARAAGAVATLSMTVQPDASVVNPGPTIGIGVGGGSFGGGWGRGGSFGGVGTSVGFPVGSATVQQGFAASTSLIDAANGQIVWSGRAVSPPSDAFIRQLIDLNRVTFEAMQKAGLF
jgi:hypothetical protein